MVILKVVFIICTTIFILRTVTSQITTCCENEIYKSNPVQECLDLVNNLGSVTTAIVDYTDGAPLRTFDSIVYRFIQRQPTLLLRKERGTTIHKSSFPSEFRYIKFEIFVILLHKEGEYEQILETMKNLSFWNPRCKSFIVVLEKTLPELAKHNILKQAWSNQIMNAIIIEIEVSNKDNIDKNAYLISFNHNSHTTERVVDRMSCESHKIRAGIGLLF